MLLRVAVLAITLITALPAPVAGQRAVEDTILWPLPPDAPRIRYAAVLRNERDLGKTRGFLGRMSNALIQKMNYMKSKHRSGLLLRKWSQDGYWCR